MLFGIGAQLQVTTGRELFRSLIAEGPLGIFARYNRRINIRAEQLAGVVIAELAAASGRPATKHQISHTTPSAAAPGNKQRLAADVKTSATGQTAAIIAARASAKATSVGATTLIAERTITSNPITVQKFCSTNNEQRVGVPDSDVAAQERCMTYDTTFINVIPTISADITSQLVIGIRTDCAGRASICAFLLLFADAPTWALVIVVISAVTRGRK